MADVGGVASERLKSFVEKRNAKRFPAIFAKCIPKPKVPASISKCCAKSSGSAKWTPVTAPKWKS